MSSFIEEVKNFFIIFIVVCIVLLVLGLLTHLLCKGDPAVEIKKGPTRPVGTTVKP